MDSSQDISLTGRRAMKRLFTRWNGRGMHADPRDRTTAALIETDFRLLDQGVESTDATPVASGHAIDFIHDETSLVRHSNSRCVSYLPSY